MMSVSEYKAIVAALVLGAITGCAGNGKGLDQNGQPIGSGSSGAAPLTADFQSIQDNVFTPICTACHIGASAPQGLQLDAAHSYNLLVGVPSAEQSSVLRVKPGDPDNSYLVRKLEGAAGITGEQMPFGGPYLPQATIDVIRQWITDGAMQVMAAHVVAASEPVQRFVVTATVPDQGSIVTMVLPTIVVAFNHELDASLVNYTTVTLEKTDSVMMMLGDRSTSAGASAALVAISTAIADGNPSVILITPRAPLEGGSYRVTLRGTGGGALADVSSQALGIDYSFMFTVDARQ